MIWITMGLVLFLTLIYWNVVTYQNFQILGVAFAPEHAESKEVQTLQENFRRRQILMGLGFIILTLLLKLDMFDGSRDTIQLILLFVYIIMSYLPFQNLQQKLIDLKHEKGWVYEQKKRRADLRVSREKGKAAPSPIWIWLVWILSGVPLIIAIASGAPFEVNLPLLIVSILLLVLPLSYNKAISQKTPVVFEDSDLTLAYTRRYEGIQGRGYLLTTLSVTVFLVILTWFTLRGTSGLEVVLLLLGFILILMGIIFYIFQKNQELQTEFFEAEAPYINESSGHYKWGFYHNPKDYRLFVPKQASGMGTTINIARPAGKIIMAITVIFLIIVLVVVLVMSAATFDVQIAEEGVAIEVPLYESYIPVEEIERAELTQTSLEGTRTNGYGGQDKAYGYFTLEEYGLVKLYIYPDNPHHIDLLLNSDENPRWIIFNEPTVEETEALYEEIQRELNH